MPQEKHILVVDDERSIQKFIRRNLELRAFKVSLANNGLEALALFEQTNFALIILDIMMPHMDGLEVCRRIRQHSTVPIIILTALGEEADKIAALDQGADDYLTKPFGVGELLARIKAVLRRNHWADHPISVGTQRFGDLEIDFEQRRVWKKIGLIKISPSEVELLQGVGPHPGKFFIHHAHPRRCRAPTYHSDVPA